MTIDFRKIYSHADGGNYRVLDTDVSIKCLVTGEWHPGVLYEAEHAGMVRYVRTQKDFLKRFTPEDSCICCRRGGRMLPTGVNAAGTICSTCNNCGAVRVGTIWTWSQAHYDAVRVEGRINV